MSETNNVRVTLLPCPFCGAPAELEDGSDHHGTWFNLGCSRHWGHVRNPDHTNTCIAGRVFYTETEVPLAEAIAAWNTRHREAAEAAASARIEQLEAECFKLAAGVCINPGQHGLVGDEYGNSICTAHEALVAEEKAHSEALAELAAAKAREAALVEALTPSGDTKAAYHGEFSFQLFRGVSDAGIDQYEKVCVPWTTVKEIMAAISARAALTKEPDA